MSLSRTVLKVLAGKYMKKNVIVVGGAGFIGSNLSEALIKEGYAVHIIDSFVGGRRDRVPAQVVLHEIDIVDAEKTAQVFSDIADIYCVFHLAALPRVQFSIEHPLESNQVNVEGTLSVLVASVRAKARRIVYSASSSAYGDQDVLPLHEELVASPKSPYGLQKYVGELYMRLWSEVYGLPTVSLRYFNVYGPKLDPEGPYALVMGKFLKQRQEGKPLTITGDGAQTRDFTHVRDVVRANMSAMESTKVGKGEVINIGAGRNVSINDLAKLFGGPVEHIEPRLEPKHTRADNRRAKELLGWEPTVFLEEGVAELKTLFGIA